MSYRTSSSSRTRHFLVFALLMALVTIATAGLTSADERPTAIKFANTEPGAIPQLSLKAITAPTKRVLITNESLHPSRVTLEAGERVVWESYSRSATAIVFEREVAASMVCHSLVNFFLEEDELRSAEIHTGEKASFCELKPGQYRYRAVRANPQSGNSVSAAKFIDGWIVVKEPKDERGA